MYRGSKDYGHVAQWTRACGYELQCRGFESLLAHYFYFFYFLLGCSQVVRQLTLTQLSVGSSPPIPDFLFI